MNKTLYPPQQRLLKYLSHHPATKKYKFTKLIENVSSHFVDEKIDFFRTALEMIRVLNQMDPTTLGREISQAKIETQVQVIYQFSVALWNYQSKPAKL